MKQLYQDFPNIVFINKNNVLNARKNFRKQHDIDQNQCCVVFFGQPLWDLKGYSRTILTLSKIIQTKFKSYQLVYKTHPREDILQIKNFKNNHLKDLSIDTSKKNENAILGSDICCSCFSNSGLDAVKILKNSRKVFTAIVYAMFEKDIVDFYKNYTGLNNLPLSDSGMSLTIRKRDEIYQILNNARTKDYYKNFYINVKKIIKLTRLLR